MQVKQCGRCGVEKPLTEFHRHPRSRDRLAYICKPCACEVARLSRLANPDRARENHRQYSAANPGKYLHLQRAWRAANPDRVKEHVRRRVPYGAQWRAERRKAVFDHYGWSCACCGTTENLAIDHVNGDGREHRTVIGNHIYPWLVKNNFPDGFQTLCLSCNASKGNGERCRLDHGGVRLVPY